MEEIHKCSYILFGWADERNTQMFIYSLFVIASGEYFFSKQNKTKQDKTRGESAMRDDDFNYTNTVTS